MTDKDSSPRQTRRGWLSLLALTIVLFAVVSVDSYLKRAPHDGFLLPDADWNAHARDLPAAWNAMEDSDTFARARTAAPELYQRAGVWTRRASGIRWTPMRWRVWFGAPLAVSVAHDDWVLSCRPGLLIRTADLADLLPNSAWRDGYLLLGSSPKIVEALRTRGVVPSGESGDDTLVCSRNGESPVDLRIRFTREWSIEGAVALTENTGERPSGTSRRVDDWPGDPAFEFYTVRVNELEQLFPDRWPDFPLRDDMREAWDTFLDRLPRNWNEGSDAYHFTLVSVDTRSEAPIPELGLITRSVSTFPPLTMPENALPYLWGASPGWMEPLYGAPMSLYVAAGPRMRVFTNQEPTMAGLLDRPLTGRIVSYDTRLDADLAQLALIAKSLTRTAAEQELLPGYNKEDVERRIVPWLNAAGALGELHAEGRVVESRLEFAGAVRPVPEQAETKE